MNATKIGLICLGLCGGCASAPEAKPTPSVTTSTTAPRAAGEAKLGDTAICPVSHETFKVTEQSPKRTYAGETIYFCCDECAQNFDKKPTAYTSK